jgi:hypothetical protein
MRKMKDERKKQRKRERRKVRDRNMIERKEER